MVQPAAFLRLLKPQSANDAVEKPHSEHLVQLWGDFFQTKPSSSFLAPYFPKLFSLPVR